MYLDLSGTQTALRGHPRISDLVTCLTDVLVGLVHELEALRHQGIIPHKSHHSFS